MADSADLIIAGACKAKTSGADLVEIRLDSLKIFNPQTDLGTLVKECPLPTLFTYRFPLESIFGQTVPVNLKSP